MKKFLKVVSLKGGNEMKTFVTKTRVALWSIVFLFALMSTVSAAPTNLLGWGPEQDANWTRMKNENHFLWQDLSSQADRNDISGDSGYRDAMMYLITGDASRALQAYQRIRKYKGRTKSGSEPYGRDETRQMFMRMAIMYDWIADALPAQDKADFKDILNHWTDLCLQDLPWGTRASDSDEAVGHYFGMVIFALAIQDEDPVRSAEILNANPGTATPPMGGLSSTGSNFNTLRNAITLFSNKAAGGQWMESSQYNINTVHMLLTGVEAINNFVGSDMFPEITAMYPAFAKAFVEELTPRLNDSYQWGDVQNARSLTHFRRVGLMSSLAAISNDPVASYIVWGPGGFYEDNAPTLADEWVFLHADPYAPQIPPSGVTSHHASGRGMATHHSGWGNNDSFYTSMMANKINVDHEIESLNNFGLYRNSHWSITSPVGYTSQDDSPYSNTLMVNGAFGLIREARGEIAFEAGNQFLYHAGTTGGAPYSSSYYDPPPETVHEWTRSTLYLHNDDGSDSIIVFDRVNADHPQTKLTAAKYNRYRSREKGRLDQSGGNHQWLIHMPDSTPTINGDTINWTDIGGEVVTLKTYMQDYTIKVIDEKVNSVGGSPFIGYGTISTSELRTQLRIIPNSLAKWQTFMNVLHVGSSLQSEHIKSYAGESAEALKLVTSSDVKIAFFNGKEGPYIPPSVQKNGLIPVNYGKLGEIKQSHYFNSGFDMNFDVNGLTKLFFMDLNPVKEWIVRINGTEQVLAVSSSGFAKLEYVANGAQSLKLFFGNEAPKAMMDTPLVVGFEARFNASNSTDPNGDPLSYSWDFGDGNSSSAVSPEHTYSSEGTFSVSLVVSDGKLTSTASKSVVIKANQKPTINLIGDKAVTEGESLTITVSATDPDPNVLILSAALDNGSSLSTIGASFTDHNNGTGTFSFAPTSGQAGQYIIMFKVFDGEFEDFESVIINVIQSSSIIEHHWLEVENADSMVSPLVIANDSYASEGKYIHVPNGGGYVHSDSSVMASFSVNIVEGGTYLLWGRVSAASGADDSFWIQVDDGPINLWDFTREVGWVWEKVSNRDGETPVKFYLAAGPHTIKVLPREDGGKIDKLLLTNKQNFTPTNIGSGAENLGVVPDDGSTPTPPVNDPPSLSVIGNGVLNVGDSLTLSLLATDPNSDPLVLSGTLLNGDSFSTIGAVFTDNGDGTGSFQCNPSVLDIGTTTLVFKVSDGEFEDVQNFNITVNALPNNIPTIAVSGSNDVTVGNLLSLNISASDLDGDALVISGELLDGSALSTIGASLVDYADGTGTFTFTPSVSHIGSHTVVFKVSDGTNEMLVNFIINVSDIPNVAPSISLVGGNVVDEGATLSIVVNGLDADGDSLTLSSILSSGNALSTIGASFVDNGDGTGLFTMTPTASHVGAHTIVFKVFDGNLEASINHTITVKAKVFAHEFHWLEAEYANSLKYPFRVGEDLLANEDMFLYTPNGAGYQLENTDVMATYTIDIRQAGNYYLWGRAISPNGADDSFYVQIDNGSIQLWDVSRDSKWHWDYVSHRGVSGMSKFYLTAGVHTIKVKVREDGTKLDRLLLTSDKNYKPFGIGLEAENIIAANLPKLPPKTKFTFEAENTNSMHSDFKVKGNSSASQGRYIEAPNGTGYKHYNTSSMATYTFDVEVEGEYIVWGRVIAPSGTDDSFWVQVDDGKNHLWDTKRTSYWQWDQVDNRGETKSSKFFLTKGQHTLKVKVREDGTRLDKLIVTNDQKYRP